MKQTAPNKAPTKTKPSQSTDYKGFCGERGKPYSNTFKTLIY